MNTKRTVLFAAITAITVAAFIMTASVFISASSSQQDTTVARADKAKTDAVEGQSDALPLAPAEQPINTDDIYALVNAERAKANLAPLVRNKLLDVSASAKCNDMVAKDYWAHDAPDGTEPWVFIKDVGVYYMSAGENLAFGQDSSNEVVRSWMDSVEHKKNILDVSFDQVGYAICTSENYTNHGKQNIIVQHFIKSTN